MLLRRRAICFGILFPFVIWLGGGWSLGAQAANHEAALAAYGSGNEKFDACRFAEAAVAYERAIQLDPQVAAAYHNLALADEMVDRPKAMKEWQRFIDLAEKDPSLKFDAARAEARLQLYQFLPNLPPAMQTSRYVTGAGDYYWEVAESADENLWRTFPVKVNLGSAPQAKWKEGARDAFDIWQALFPLQLVARAEQADIRVDWLQTPDIDNAVGEDWERPKWEIVGGEMQERRICTIGVNLYQRNWSKDEMRAIILHELGHAMGIKGHSDSKKDIMYGQMQDKLKQVYVPSIPFPISWRSLVKQPSQRDINTLIRLYNSPGLAKRMQ